MEHIKTSLKGGASALLTSLIVQCFVMLPLTSSAPAPAGTSHLVMWMKTEKQLVPTINGLAQTARDLFTYACEQENGALTLDECMDFANSLPNITGLNAVPSKETLKKEEKKDFVKVLVLNAYESLEELQDVLDKHVFHVPCKDPKPGVCRKMEHFERSLHIATNQYKDLVTSFYKASPSKNKPKKVQVPKGLLRKDTQVVIKILSIAVDRFNEIKSVLEYSVELSWFSRLQGGKKKGRRGKAGKTKKNKPKNSS